MKVDRVRVIRVSPPPERSESIPCLLVATFLVNPFPNLIAVKPKAGIQRGAGITTSGVAMPDFNATSSSSSDKLAMADALSLIAYGRIN